jgi:predicted metal-dependent phosphoesterase TrpH
VKLDGHVHTYYSGYSTVYPVHRILKESYNSPEGLYRCAKARGMDLVTITDHDSIDGVLTIAHRSDVIVGCEVTAIFPEDGTNCHINVLGITEQQHRDIQELRHNVYELMPYLKQKNIFCTLNHLASTSAGRLNASQIWSLLPWISAIETRNGTRLPSQNQTASALANAHRKVATAGSDSHTYRGIGRTYMVCDKARNREEFLGELRKGRVGVAGWQGCYLTLTADILRITARFYADGIARLIERPLEWKRHVMVVGSTLGLSLVPVALIGSIIHYILDERFNYNLLIDLVAQPIEPATRPSVRVLEPAV